MNFCDKYIRKGIRTASRVYHKETVVILLPGPITPSEKGYGLFLLGNTATSIWKMLERPCQIKKIITTIAKRKKVKPSQVAARLTTFIKDLSKNHLIDIVSKPKPSYY